MHNTIYSSFDNITAHDKDFVQINPSLVFAYNALPRKYIQESSAIFLGIIHNKYYGRTNKPNEDKRIYNDTQLDPKDILMSLNPEKYLDTNKIDTDATNLLKKLRILQDNNVFYWFTYGSSYMFFMERAIWTWKFFNSSGCVPPKSLRKIVNLSDDFLHKLVSFERTKGHKATFARAQLQYVQFLMKMISKMRPEVASLLPKWEKGQNVQVFINDLKIALGDMNDYLGFTHSSDFIQKLPLFIRGKVDGYMNEIELKNTQNTRNTQSAIVGDSMKTVMEMEELLPDNINIGKKKRTRNRIISHKKVYFDKAEISNWKNDEISNPLETEKAFIAYYKNTLKFYANQNLNGISPTFDNYLKEVRHASEILDLLKDSGRKTELFVERWVKYYCKNFLKGTKIHYAKHTSLSSFQNTFEEFKKIFHMA